MALADTRFLTRRRTLAARLAAQRIDSMLVTSPLHVRYLSGFTGDDGALVLSKDLSATICTDGRYATQVAEEVPDIQAVIDRAYAATLLDGLDRPRRVGFEADYLSVSELEKLRESAGEDITLVPVSGVIEEIRLVKDGLELTRLREVAALANEAFKGLIDDGELAVGRAEREVAADLEHRMRLNGGESTSFPTIVASGPNSAKPHHGAGERIIEKGDLVTIDFGALRLGYNSDMTRTLVMGEPDEFSREIYEVVRRAQQAGIEAATVGRPVAEVDAAARAVISEAGYGEYFVHSTGHGVGRQVHEAPFASQRGQGTLAENMTLTIEPGIYVPGRGGVRIEDTLIITPGRPEIITEFPRELTVID